MLLYTKARFVSALLFTLLSTPLFATQLTIVDSQGKPVSGAVIGMGPILLENTASSASDPAIMDQVHFQFVPKILVINKGQWVDFPNSDDVRHHIYSFSAPNPFEIKMFSRSEAPPMQFTKSGIVVLGCNIHDSMVGYIYVAETQFVAMSDASGIVDIGSEILTLNSTEKSADGFVKATLWHPLLSAAHTNRIDISIDPALEKQEVRLQISLNTSADNKKANGFASKFRSGK